MDGASGAAAGGVGALMAARLGSAGDRRSEDRNSSAGACAGSALRRSGGLRRVGGAVAMCYRALGSWSRPGFHHADVSRLGQRSVGRHLERGSRRSQYRRAACGYTLASSCLTRWWVVSTIWTTSARACASICGERPSRDACAVLHHELDALEHGHVAERVARYGDQVGALARFQAADLVAPGRAGRRR